jgi:hypothetical protein
VRVLGTALSLAALTGAACSEREEPMTPPLAAPSPPRLVQAQPELRARCQATANHVGYPVPCPTRVPAGLAATRAIGGCELEIIGAGGLGGCGKAWRGWVVGSSETNEQHLVLVASPRVLRDAAKIVNGPAWYQGARVRPLQSLTINGWRMRAVFVPPETNQGSAFARHLVLIWTVSGHTYGVGFHKANGVRQTLDLDKAIARGIKLVPTSNQ